MRFARGLNGVVLVAVLVAACATTKEAATGDTRLDDTARADRLPVDKGDRACGPDTEGDLVLLDARTGGPATCLRLTILLESTCASESDCPAPVVFNGHSNALGQVKLNLAVSKANLLAIADGYAPSRVLRASTQAGKLIELELAPEAGFWLKVLDAEGNYLQALALTFRQGTEVVAQVRTNTLANVFFAQRQPFAGEAVTVEATGFQPATLTDLGEDGHTLVLAH